MKKFFKILYTISLFTFTIVLLVISTLAIYIINISPEMDYTKLIAPNNTKILDSNGNVVSTVGAKLTNYVPIDKINRNMQNAIVSVEDNSFYIHNGINPSRIVTSTINNLISQSYSEGASTINQQLIKNLFLTNDKSLKRKLQEISMAIKLDKELTKDQILEAYLNNILFGGNIYGVEMASNYYFNKSSSDLTIEDSALLAGIIQLPNYYNPYKNPEAATKRRNTVIDSMYKYDYISLLEANNAKEIKIENQLKKGEVFIKEDYATAYLNYLYTYMLDNHNININDADYKIKTSMNSSIQKEIYKIMNNEYNYFPDDDIKCAIVCIDNATGNLLGISGNRTNSNLVFDYATALIQPGSTIKPILDYAPAIEYYNLSPASIILDEPYTYSNGFNINNWDYQYKGYITLRQALSESRNIPAVKLFQMVGKEKALEFAKRLNIIPTTEVYESEAIGGSTYGYSLLNLTGAYTAFANLGKFKKISPLLTFNGNNSFEDRKTTTVMKETTAFLINDMLHDVFKDTNYDLTNTYLMAKTGQTNYDIETKRKYQMSSDAVKDSLVISYTKDITIGIWCSYDTKTKWLTSSTKNIPRTIMNHMMNKFAKNSQYYETPDDISYIKVLKDNDTLYLANTSNYTNSFYDYFISGTEPYSYKTKKDYIKS